MGRRARVVVVGCSLAGSGGLVACNALTGASDLQFDEAAPALDATRETSQEDVTVPQSDAYAPTDAAAGADADAEAAAPCTPTSTVESVMSSPTTFANGTQVGSVPWVISMSGSRATLTAAEVSSYLVSTGLGLDAMLPETAAIKGFIVSVTRSGDEPGEIADNGVALVRGLVPGAPKTSSLSWPPVLEPIQYGSSVDLWAPTTTPWTAADVRSADFGVAISARGVNAAMTTARVSTITVRVFFIRCPGP